MKYFLTSLSIFLIVLFSNAQDNPKDISPFFSYSTFYSPEQGSYIETYLTILGHSLYFEKTESGKYMSSVEVTMLIKFEEEIIDFEKLILKSPEVEDTSNINFSLVDIQRFALPNGNYSIEIKLQDLYSPFDPLYIIEAFELNYLNSTISLSGIQLIERYQKSDATGIFNKAGYELMPLPLNFYPKSVNTLTFYCEAYNTATILGEDEAFLIKTYIEQFETRRVAQNLQSFKREKGKNLISYMHEFDISTLPSGNYLLVVELRDKNNELKSINKLFFQRSNPDADIDFLASKLTHEYSFVANITSKDTLLEYVRSVRPIASDNERFYIDKHAAESELERLQQFFYTFWANRSDQPEDAWRKYSVEVQKTQNSFATKIKKGYQTDRGRVYLQYGPPNTISRQDREPSTYPYEIWHYYTLNNQRNRKFVFYNRDLATQDYELLHSDAIGEIQDYQWQVKLNQRNFATNDPDLERSDWGWGSRVDDYWRNPR